ncbi:KfrA, partial [Salmonella enterica]|nr:KfrA [Salmonella enterica]
MAITEEQIMRAADELDQEGQNPTLARVRKKLGGGSFTTISEV